MTDEIGAHAFTAGELAEVMTPRQQFVFRVGRALTRIARKLPRLVWYDDEVDVVVTFTASQLPPGLEVHEAFKELYSGALFEMEKQLSRLGIGFDKGMGFEGRDWEWDWSLSGPISVRFRRRAKKPERRLGRPGARSLNVTPDREGSQ